MFRFLHILKPRCKMDSIRKQVFKTFGDTSTLEDSNFDKNLQKLIDMMNNLTAEDVKLDLNLVKPAPINATDCTSPVSYVEILEHRNFTINMFILRPEACLPLHDHPRMHGICKVVHGKVKIRNFSVEAENGVSSDSDQILAIREPDRFVSSTDPPVLLTPTHGNIHEISAVESEGAAFVDVLAPPYETTIQGTTIPRVCHYYLEGDTSDEETPFARLYRVTRIPGYSTDFAPYLGP